MSARLVVSRRALGAKILSPIFQHRLQQAKMAEMIAMAGGNKSIVPPNKDTTPWPRSLQIVGYAIIAFTIPYTASVILVESRTIREWVENNMGSCGGKIIRGVRWYWGEEEALPYGPLLEEFMHQRCNKVDAEKMGKITTAQEETRVSLIGKEDSATVRLEQERILERIHSPIQVTILGTVIEIPPLLPSTNGGKQTTPKPYIEPDGISIELSGTLHIHDTESLVKEIDEKGTVYMIEDNFEEIQTSLMDQLALSFNQDESNMDKSIQDEYQESNNFSPAVARSFTVWSAWHHFKATSLSPFLSSNQSSKGYYDDLSLKIDEIQYKLSELQRNMNDPSCLRDRDDLEKEYQELRIELGRLKRAKLLRRLKSLVYM